MGLWEDALRLGLERDAPEKLSPGQITDLALKSECGLATEALSIFCAILGTVAASSAAATQALRHSAAVGSRKRRPVCADSQRQKLSAPTRSSA